MPSKFTPNFSKPAGPSAPVHKKGWPAEPTPSDHDDPSGLGVQVGGDATAIGNSTVASGDVVTHVVDQGHITTASGSANFAAHSHSSDGAPAASAGTFVNFADADFSVALQTNHSSYATDHSGGTASQTSSLQFAAVDIEGWSSPHGPIHVGVGLNFEFDVYAGAHPAPSIDGNLSTLDVDAKALGPNTFVDVQSSVLTFEDQLSTVNTYATIAAA